MIFGSQIQGVQGDEPGEAVMLDENGQVPSSGGGSGSWSRIAFGTALTAGRIYKIIGPYGSAEFVKNENSSQLIYFPYYCSVTQAGTGGTRYNRTGRWVNVNLDGTLEYRYIEESGVSSKPAWTSVEATDQNTALFVMED